MNSSSSAETPQRPRTTRTKGRKSVEDYLKTKYPDSSFHSLAFVKNSCVEGDDNFSLRNKKRKSKSLLPPKLNVRSSQVDSDNEDVIFSSPSLPRKSNAVKQPRRRRRNTKVISDVSCSDLNKKSAGRKRGNPRKCLTTTPRNGEMNNERLADEVIVIDSDSSSTEPESDDSSTDESLIKCVVRIEKLGKEQVDKLLRVSSDSDESEPSTTANPCCVNLTRTEDSNDLITIKKDTKSESGVIDGNVNKGDLMNCLRKVNPPPFSNTLKRISKNPCTGDENTKKTEQAIVIIHSNDEGSSSPKRVKTSGESSMKQDAVPLDLDNELSGHRQTVSLISSNLCAIEGSISKSQFCDSLSTITSHSEDTIDKEKKSFEQSCSESHDIVSVDSNLPASDITRDENSYSLVEISDNVSSTCNVSVSAIESKNSDDEPFRGFTEEEISCKKSPFSCTERLNNSEVQRQDNEENRDSCTSRDVSSSNNVSLSLIESEDSDDEPFKGFVQLSCTELPSNISGPTIFCTKSVEIRTNEKTVSSQNETNVNPGGLEEVTPAKTLSALKNTQADSACDVIDHKTLTNQPVELHNVPNSPCEENDGSPTCDAVPVLLNAKVSLCGNSSSDGYAMATSELSSMICELGDDKTSKISVPLADGTHTHESPVEMDDEVNVENLRASHNLTSLSKTEISVDLIDCGCSRKKEALISDEITIYDRFETSGVYQDESRGGVTSLESPESVGVLNKQLEQDSVAVPEELNSRENSAISCSRLTLNDEGGSAAGSMSCQSTETDNPAVEASFCSVNQPFLKPQLKEYNVFRDVERPQPTIHSIPSNSPAHQPSSFPNTENGVEDTIGLQGAKSTAPLDHVIPLISDPQLSKQLQQNEESLLALRDSQQNLSSSTNSAYPHPFDMQSQWQNDVRDELHYSGDNLSSGANLQRTCFSINSPEEILSENVHKTTIDTLQVINQLMSTNTSDTSRTQIHNFLEAGDTTEALVDACLRENLPESEDYSAQEVECAEFSSVPVSDDDSAGIAVEGEQLLKEVTSVFQDETNKCAEPHLPVQDLADVDHLEIPTPPGVSPASSQVYVDGLYWNNEPLYISKSQDSRAPSSLDITKSVDSCSNGTGMNIPTNSKPESVKLPVATLAEINQPSSNRVSTERSDVSAESSAQTSKTEVEEISQTKNIHSEHLMNDGNDSRVKVNDLLFDEEFERGNNSTPVKTRKAVALPSPEHCMSDLLFDEEFERSNNPTPSKKVDSVTISRVRRRVSELLFDEEFEETNNVTPTKRQVSERRQSLDVSPLAVRHTSLGPVNDLVIDDNDEPLNPSGQPVIDQSSHNSESCTVISSDEDCEKPPCNYPKVTNPTKMNDTYLGKIITDRSSGNRVLTSKLRRYIVTKRNPPSNQTSNVHNISLSCSPPRKMSKRPLNYNRRQDGTKKELDGKEKSGFAEKNNGCKNLLIPRVLPVQLNEVSSVNSEFRCSSKNSKVLKTPEVIELTDSDVEELHSDPTGTIMFSDSCESIIEIDSCSKLKNNTSINSNPSDSTLEITNEFFTFRNGDFIPDRPIEIPKSSLTTELGSPESLTDRDFMDSDSVSDEPLHPLLSIPASIPRNSKNTIVTSKTSPKIDPLFRASSNGFIDCNSSSNEDDLPWKASPRKRRVVAVKPPQNSDSWTMKSRMLRCPSSRRLEDYNYISSSDDDELSCWSVPQKIQGVALLSPVKSNTDLSKSFNASLLSTLRDGKVFYDANRDCRSSTASRRNLAMKTNYIQVPHPSNPISVDSEVKSVSYIRVTPARSLNPPKKCVSNPPKRSPSKHISNILSGSR